MIEPPIYLKSDFLDSHLTLFESLKSNTLWDERMKARKTASFGVSYDYSQITYPATPMPPDLQSVADKIAGELGLRANNCLLNYYESGRSTMGFHSDATEDLEDGTGVAIVSLGCTRSIVLRSYLDRTQQFSYQLPSGSLLYLSNEVQEDWQHAIPKSDEAGERISLTFRSIVK